MSSTRKRGWRRVAWPVLRPILRAVGWKRAWGDDWNYWWAEQFDGYRFLPEKLGEFIELGCGPYTNTRIIFQERTASRVVCSDPLAETYIQLKDRWLAHAHREGLVEIDSHPIEELPFEPGYLRRRGDEQRFGPRARRGPVPARRPPACCDPAAYFIHRPGPQQRETTCVNHPHDIGHPTGWGDGGRRPAPGRASTPFLRKELSRDEGRDPRLHYATLIYAGTKRAD